MKKKLIGEYYGDVIRFMKTAKQGSIGLHCSTLVDLQHNLKLCHLT